MNIPYDSHTRSALGKVLASWPDRWYGVSIVELAVHHKDPSCWCLTVRRLGSPEQEKTTYFHDGDDCWTLKEVLLRLEAAMKQEKTDVTD